MINAAAILSAGKGTRFGSDLPKQFLEIDGMPVLIRSAKAFLDCGEISLCIVASGADFKEYTESLLQKYFPNDTRLRVITGGETRSETLLKILEYLRENELLDGCALLTHDAVRPFITQRIIKDNIEACRKYGSAFSAAVPGERIGAPHPGGGGSHGCGKRDPAGTHRHA